MADTVYRIRIDYNANTAEAERGAERVASGFGAIKAAVLGAAGALGVSALASKIFELGREAEDTKISIAGMMQAGGASGLTTSAQDFALSMGMSGEIIKQMRKDARELPGEFEDLMNVFRMGIGGGLNAGKSVYQIEQLSARVMSFGAMMRMNSEMVGREFAMMMEGRAGAHNVLFQRLHTQIGKTAVEFNALSAPEKWKLIDNALKGYDPAIKQFGTSWSAISSTTKDFVQQLIRVGGLPVFEMVKRHLNDWNDWFAKNQDYVEKMATEWGTRLAGGIETAYGWAKSLVGVIVDNRETLLKVAEAYLAIKGVSAFGGSNFKGAGGVAGGLANMAGGAGMGVAISAMFGDISSTGGTLNATLMGVEGAMSRLPGPIGMVTTGLLAFHAALQFGADELDKNHKAKLEKDVETQRLMSAYKAFELNEKRSSTFDFDKRASLIAQQYRLIKPDGTLDYARLGQYLGSGPGGTLGMTFVDDAGKAAAVRMFQAYAKYHPENTTPFGPAMPTPEQLALNRNMPARNTTVNVTNNNHIVQTIENAHDPDRVLVKTKEALESIYRHERVSPYSRFATMR